MVQWIPTFGTLALIFLLNMFINEKCRLLISKVTIIVGVFFLGIVLTMSETPFASPSNAFARPFAHSIAPIQRPDMTNLATLKTDLNPLILSGASIVSLNESQEFNQGTLKAMFQTSNFKKIALLPIGTMDYRDDPGFRNFFDADFLLVPDPYIPLIPEYQNTLKEFNSEFQSTAEASGYWQKMASYRIGDISSSSNWWSVDYAKKQMKIGLYKRVVEIPEEYRRNFVQNIDKNTQKKGTMIAKVQLVSGSVSSIGASLANNAVVRLRLTQSSPSALVYLKNTKINFDSTCEALIEFHSGISKKIKPGNSTLNGNKGVNQFLRFTRLNSDPETCEITIRSTNR
jgi:hypothetical protein